MTKPTNTKVPSAMLFRSPTAIFPPTSYASHKPSANKLTPISAWFLIAGMRAVSMVFRLATEVFPRSHSTIIAGARTYSYSYESGYED